MKTSRHGKILEIIRENHVRTQKELADFLGQNGMKVTQATLSRDIKDLKLIKVHNDSGDTVYAVGGEEPRYHTSGTIYTESVLSVDYAMNIVVVKTLSGMAQGVASLLDRMNLSDILGTIAGDDTIMIVARTEEEAKRVASDLADGVR